MTPRDKPHFFRFAGAWFCFHLGHLGAGETWQEAYIMFVGTALGVPMRWLPLEEPPYASLD